MAETQDVDIKETSGAIVDNPEPPATEEEAPAEPMDEFQVGMWHHYKNYGCPHCSYLTIKGPEDVMWHIHNDHPNIGIGTGEDNG